MAQHEVSLPDVMRPAEELAQRLGARAMPIQAKRRLANAGNALDEALTAAQDYLGTLDASLGKSAEVSASKMRYQMDRLRRLAATYELTRKPACASKPRRWRCTSSQTAIPRSALSRAPGFLRPANLPAQKSPGPAPG